MLKLNPNPLEIIGHKKLMQYCDHYWVENNGFYTLLILGEQNFLLQIFVNSMNTRSLFDVQFYDQLIKRRFVNPCLLQYHGAFVEL